jgi:hypothetical protein
MGRGTLRPVRRVGGGGGSRYRSRSHIHVVSIAEPAHAAHSLLAVFEGVKGTVLTTAGRGEHRAPRIVLSLGGRDDPGHAQKDSQH